ncbi:CHRD domain-containing protein [Pyxidicoccus trucidator]|uniref:CHRD domain-containing protein n=1 Tax=Pyxidicoccus trucidator TaxID=2709662 RepID=UPI0013DC76B2|nr:CHRD domain-containing protein [Pyxidicoccus trucidator]
MRREMLTRLAVPGLVACVLWLTGCGNNTEADTTLAGGNEVPPVTTSATGAANAELEGDELVVNGSFSNLSSDLFPVGGSAAHVHNAPGGENGPILFNLEVSSTDNRNGTFIGRKTLTEDEKVLFEDGNLYVNIHTANFNSGELRGQFKP